MNPSTLGIHYRVAESIPDSRPPEFFASARGVETAIFRI
jgi:hypothetical protein